MTEIVDFFINIGISFVDKFGYFGIFLTMALESAAIPIPSEIVVPLGGFNAALGAMSLWLVATVATLANLAGGVLLYYVGLCGGRPLAERYGKYVLIHKDDLAKMDGWLARHGYAAVFFSRLLPGIRTFSSLIFGAARVAIWPFIWITAAGSFIWNFALAYAGFVMGENWTALRGYFEEFEIVIVVLIALAVAAFVLRHLRRR